MAREILFKAKRIDNGEWLYWNLYGELCRKSGKRTRLAIKNGTTTYYYDYIDQATRLIDKATICQYTGLTDKNGNKIWENDIVEEDWGNYKGIVRFGEFDSLVLKNIGFNIEWRKAISYRQDFLYWTDKLEVIGNIFDNPELLEGGVDNAE